jgi:hypothetical protein
MCEVKNDGVVGLLNLMGLKALPIKQSIFVGQQTVSVISQLGYAGFRGLPDNANWRTDSANDAEAEHAQ